MKIHITNLISRLFGSFANTTFYPFIQNIINVSYVKLLKLDMSEFDKPSSYESLNALFTRELKVKRGIDASKQRFISPSDGYISECGDIQKGRALQIKGFSYSVKELLTDKIKASKDMEGGYFLNIYLSPKDYHRFHSPLDMQVLKAVQIPGKLYPVNFRYLHKISSLFCQNERVVLECTNETFGRFYLVFVGALNVGKIAFNFDKNIQTNAKNLQVNEYIYEDVSLKKGEELGRFEMGSTIAIIFEKRDLKLAKSEKNIKFADVLIDADVK